VALGALDHDSMLYKVRILELLGKRDDALSTLATSFKQGTTKFEIEAMPDLLPLRKDARYSLIDKQAAPGKVS
jgi:hypothetical protein